MDDSKHTPGNANLPIGVVSGGQGVLERREGRGDPTAAIRENGGPRWHSRGYLPHFDCCDLTQHVTFHLADSLPRTVLQRLEGELKLFPEEKRDIERRKRTEGWMDAGHGSCILRNPPIADMVQRSLLTFDVERYRLLAWVVMPNHVHVLFQPINGWTVAKIVASWKKFTARQICDDRRNRREASDAPVWHREYWDRFIRNETHFLQAVDYIHENPVKAGSSLLRKAGAGAAPILEITLGTPISRLAVGGTKQKTPFGRMALPAKNHERSGDSSGTHRSGACRYRLGCRRREPHSQGISHHSRTHRGLWPSAQANYRPRSDFEPGPWVAASIYQRGQVRHLIDTQSRQFPSQPRFLTIH